MHCCVCSFVMLSMVCVSAPSFLKFHLNTIHDVAHTPINMNPTWSYGTTLTLGSAPCVGGIHVTSSTSWLFALWPETPKSNYNWRHDNVLRVIAGALLVQVRRFNRGEHVQKPHKEWTKFKSKKTQYGRPERKMEMKKSLPGEAKDWKILWDEDKYPAHFLSTSTTLLRCQIYIVVWSDSSKQVILIELTCGDESNFDDQVERKRMDTIES